MKSASQYNEESMMTRLYSRTPKPDSSFPCLIQAHAQLIHIHEEQTLDCHEDFEETCVSFPQA
ncbi:hypothetical protein Dimus_039189 [Dionaea muscipula]